MMYEIRERKSIKAEVHRILQEEVEFSVQQLQKQRQIDLGILQAKQSFSRINTLLALLQEAFGEKKFAKTVQRFLLAQKELDELRNFDSLRETLDVLKSSYRRQNLHAGVEASKAHLMIWQELAKKEWKDQEEDQRPEVVALLEKALKKFSLPKKAGDDFTLIRSDLEAQYKACKKAFHKSQKKKKSRYQRELLAEVTTMVLQLQLVKNCWPEMMNPMIAEFHRFASLLKHTLNLTLLKDHIEGERLIPGRVRGKADVLNGISELRDQLRSKSTSVGERIFYYTEEVFFEAIAHYWTLWRKEEPIEQSDSNEK